MMRLSTMWKVVATVGDGGACPLAAEILKPWGCAVGTLRFYRASANFICEFMKEGRRHFLRFSDAGERPLEAILAEVKLVAWLGRQGIKVAAPVPSGQGRLVETVETALGRFHGVVFLGLEGSQLETAECQETHFRAWGAALGRLHAAMKAYQDPSAASRPSWRDHLAEARPYVDGEPALLAEWHRLESWASALPSGPDDFGLIHFDFESDNLCWQDGAIGILDFDDSAHYWYAADIAYALRDLFKEGAGLSSPQVQSFLAGYEGEHPLNRTLSAQLPQFLRLHGMYTYARLSRALDLPADREPPAWLKRVETKLRHVREAYRMSVSTP
ncbi:MAG TPA: phosphotransferase [Symbiobacteriaceae bacterium]|nr:phosphotransferase [Symbiobacteriaceae bacterium]